MPLRPGLRPTVTELPTCSRRLTGDRQLGGIPLGRFATENDLSRVVLFLLSDESRYITGATIDVNGGSLMQS